MVEMLLFDEAADKLFELETGLLVKCSLSFAVSVGSFIEDFLKYGIRGILVVLFAFDSLANLLLASCVSDLLLDE